MAWAYAKDGKLHYGINVGEDFIEDLWEIPLKNMLRIPEIKCFYCLFFYNELIWSSELLCKHNNQSVFFYYNC